MSHVMTADEVHEKVACYMCGAMYNPTFSQMDQQRYLAEKGSAYDPTIYECDECKKLVLEADAKSIEEAEARGFDPADAEDSGMDWRWQGDDDPYNWPCNKHG